MADAEDSKSSVRKHMRVQVPPSVPLQIKGFFGLFRLGWFSFKRRLTANLTATGF